jgi:hypothetical protein
MGGNMRRYHNIIIYSLILAIMMIIFSVSSMAITDEVISNSADWRDVYSSIIYGTLLGADTKFLTSTPHGPILLFEIPKTMQGIQIITSTSKPFYIGYDSLFKSKGYANVEELIFNNANLELAKRLPNVNKFIVIDDAYGYNAIAVAPYAAKSGSYVLFASRNNIGEVSAFLNTKNVQKIIIYGRVDREVKTSVSKYNPEILNSDSGSRFENNILIVDKYAELGSVKQVILSNGEFIEASMMTGKEPVLFIGKNNVPQEIKDYISNKKIEIGVLIGNELIGSATDIRRQLGISVFVKFARGSRIPGGTINPVEDLDRFPMPSYQLSISIVSISYNKATGLLEVTYKNNVNLASFFKSTITIKGEEGQTLTVVGDDSPLFIDSEETKTIAYNINTSSMQDNISSEVYAIYGESKTSLENVLRGTFKVDIINIIDDADIEIRDLAYDKRTGTWHITIENTGKVDAYVSLELLDIWVNGEYVSAGSNDIVKIGAGQKKDIMVNLKLEDVDLTDERNSEINVRASFGERKLALVKTKTAKFQLKFRSAVGNYTTIIIVVVVIILLLFLLLIRRKKRCKRCRTLNERKATHCKKCDHEL